MRRLTAVLSLALLALPALTVGRVAARDRAPCGGIERAGAWTKVATPLRANAFAVDPQGRLFVAGDREIVRSDDGGCTWRPSLEVTTAAPAGLPMADERIVALAAAGDSLVAALTGPHVLVSTDAGATWTRSDEGLDLPGTPVALHPAPSGEVVYLVARLAVNDAGLAAAGLAEQGAGAMASVIYRSGDGGRTWERRGRPGLSYSGPHGSNVDGGRAPGGVWDVAVDPVDPNLLLVAARDGIFRSTTGGRGWEPVLSQPGIEVRTIEQWRAGGAAAAVAVDPRSGMLYVSLDPESRTWGSAAFAELRTEQMLAYPSAAAWAWSAFDESGRAVLSGPRGVFRLSGRSLSDESPPGLGSVDQTVVDLVRVETHGGASFWARLLDGSALLAQGAAPARPGPRSERGLRPRPTTPRVPRPVRDVVVPEVDRGGVALVPAEKRVVLDPGETRTLTYEARLEPRPFPMDVYFLLDTTASMSDAIRWLREGIREIVLRLARSRVVLRAGVGAFRTYPRESDRIVENYAYRRIRALGPADGDLVRSLYELEARGSSGANLAALLQAATGAGQDVLPPGPSKADIPAGGDAGFRAGATKVVVHLADTWFGTPERGDPNGNHMPGTWPGPGFEEVIATLRERGIVHLGVAMQPAAGGTLLADAEVSADLGRVSAATSSSAGGRGGDCNGDGASDIAPGEPLVCPLARDADAGALTSVVVGLVEALEDLGSVELVESAPSALVTDISPSAYPSVDLRSPQRLTFEVEARCGLDDAGRTATAHLGLRVRSTLEATAPLTVACNALPAALPRTSRATQQALPLLPPIPVLPPPRPAPGLGPGAVTPPAPMQAPAPAQAPGGQPQAALVAQRQTQPQLAFVAAVQQVRARTQMQHALVSTRARDPLATARTWTAVGGLTILWTWGLVTALAASVRRARIR